MIKINIHGMKDGEYEINLNTDISKIDCYFDEFFGSINVKGIIKKIGNRYTIVAKSSAMAHLVCDRSLENYTEQIISDINLSYIADTQAVLENSASRNDSELLIREDAQFIDITNEVIELLALNLPMKRIAPEYRNKEITDIFPELSSSRNATDETWAKLKDFKIN